MADPARSDDWEALLPRLLLWAQRLHARVLSDVRGAPTPEDLVQDAVTDVLTGRRNRPADVPLAVLLYGVIRSRASQVLSRSKTRGNTPGPRYVDLEAAERLHAQTATDSAGSSDLRERVLALVAGDDVLEQMVALWFEDPGLKPGDLAVMLGLAPAEIYAATRRLRRRGDRETSISGEVTLFDARGPASAGPWQIVGAR